MNNSVLINVYEFQRTYLDLLVDDIPEKDITIQPGAIANHPAWQLGHLVNTTNNMQAMLGGKLTLDDSWKKKFGRNSVPSPNRSDYPSKAELLCLLDERRAEFTRLFKAVSSDELAKDPSEFGVPPFFNSKGMFFTFVMTTHESTHLGQLASWRRAMALPQALSKIER
jgi:hypothetical protein